VANPTGAARLTIRRDGEAARSESVPVGREHRIAVPIERGGPTVVEIEAEPRPGEVSPLNNRQVVTINGVRDRLRVLLVSGEPHAGERTWRRLLKADPNVDLVHFTILRPPEKDDLTPLNELALIAFPVRELFQVKLREFDLIVFDRFANRGILPPIYLRNIADYVRGGGALLMSTVGPEFSGPVSLARTRRSARCCRRGRGAAARGGGRGLPAARLGPVSAIPSPRACRREQRAGGSAMGPLVSLAARRCPQRIGGDGRPRGRAADGAGPGGRRPRRAAAVRPYLALVARP
jgi:hypothetical protein